MSFFHTILASSLKKLDIPGPLFASKISTSQINLSWLNVGASTYILQRGILSDYSDATQIYSGANTSFNDTGLVMGTSYYYRVKSSNSGFSDSLWVNNNQSTLSFTPVAWYEPSGLDRPSVSNSYGVTTNTIPNVTSLSSLMGSGPVLNFNTERYNLGGTQNDSYSSLCYLQKPDQTPGSYYVAASTISFSGDFTICLYIRVRGTGTIFEKTDQSCYIRLGNANMIFRIGGTSYTISYSLGTSDFTKIVIKRTGLTIAISLDGGSTFSSLASSSATASFDNIFGGNNNPNGLWDIIRCVMIANSSLSTSQYNEVFNYETSPNYTPAPLPSPSSITTVTGITFSPFSTAPYFNPETLNLQCNGGGLYPGQYNVGDKTFLMSYNVNNGTHPNDGKFYIYDHTTTNISSVKTIAGLRNNPETHEVPSFFVYDKRVNVMQFDQHYDQVQKNFVVRSFGANFDFNNYTTIPQFNGIPVWSQVLGQYPQVIQNGNRLIRINQGWNPITSAANYTYLEYSDDGGVSWTKRTICDVSATSTHSFGDWLYPWLVYTESNDIVVVLNHTNQAAQGSQSNVMYGSFIIRANASDLNTWYNVSGNFSKNIYTNGGFSISELYTNAVVIDARLLTNSGFLNSLNQTQSGQLYGVVSDGSGTNWQLVTQDIGQNNLNKVNIDFTGHTVIYEGGLITGSFANNLYSRGAPVCIKTGANSFRIYALEVNSGNWQIIHFDTSNNGSTWTYGGIDSTDATKQHFNMMIDYNYEWCNNALLTASTALSSSTGKVFIKKIK